MPIAGDFPGSPGAVIVPLELRCRNGHPGLNTTTQARIALALRQMYCDLVDQPIPENLVELLATWDRKHSEKV